MPSRLAVPEHLFVRPLIHGLDRPDSPFEPVVDIPARNAIQFSERAGDFRCAFLSPIDYARHGADYCIVPGIAISSPQPNGIIRLLVKAGVRNICTIAVDVRVTSEILLAKIILLEKFRNSQSSDKGLAFIPMVAEPSIMLQKADAALVVSFSPTGCKAENASAYAIDLVEEWIDLTDLPYVFGFWVGREGELTADNVEALVAAKGAGLRMWDHSSHDLSLSLNIPEAVVQSYFGSLSFDLNAKAKESIKEFFQYAYFHGALQDVPELKIFGSDEKNDQPDQESL